METKRISLWAILLFSFKTDTSTWPKKLSKKLVRQYLLAGTILFLAFNMAYPLKAFGLFFIITLALLAITLVESFYLYKIKTQTEEALNSYIKDTFLQKVYWDTEWHLWSLRKILLHDPKREVNLATIKALNAKLFASEVSSTGFMLLDYTQVREDIYGFEPTPPGSTLVFQAEAKQKVYELVWQVPSLKGQFHMMPIDFYGFEQPDFHERVTSFTLWVDKLPELEPEDENILLESIKNTFILPEDKIWDCRWQGKDRITFYVRDLNPHEQHFSHSTALLLEVLEKAGMLYHQGEQAGIVEIELGPIATRLTELVHNNYGELTKFKIVFTSFGNIFETPVYRDWTSVLLSELSKALPGKWWIDNWLMEDKTLIVARVNEQRTAPLPVYYNVDEQVDLRGYLELLAQKKALYQPSKMEDKLMMEQYQFVLDAALRMLKMGDKK